MEKQGLPRRTAEHNGPCSPCGTLPSGSQDEVPAGFHVSGGARLRGCTAPIASRVPLECSGRQGGMAPRRASKPRGEQRELVLARGSGGRRIGGARGLGRQRGLRRSLGGQHRRRRCGRGRRRRREDGHVAAIGHLAQAHVLGHDLDRVAAVVGQIGRTHVIAQPAFEGAGAGDAFLQHTDADAQVAHRVEGGEMAAEVLVLVGVHPCHDLHQALGAHGALREGIEARLHGHDGQDERGIELGAAADLVGLRHQRGEGFGRHAVFLAEPERDGGLLLGQVLRVGGRGALAGFGLHGHADHRHLARLQPAHELFLSGLPQVRAGGEGDRAERDRQPDQGETAVGDFEETVDHIGCEGLHSADHPS